MAPLNEAYEALRPEDVAKKEGWPHAGPRALLEVIASILGLGLSFLTYHDYWQKQSGIHPEAAARWEHKVLCTTLALLTCLDRLDVSNCSGAEYAARRLVMLEKAVAVNPKSPSFHGLHRLIEHSLSEGGGVATRDFTAYMSQVAEADARVLKQNRLYREELATKTKTDKEEEPGSSVGSANPKRKPKKAGGTGGGGES